MVNEEVLKGIKADTPWEDVHKMADEVQKQGRVYVDNPSEAPKGTQLKRGPKGGMYYEEHGGAEKPKEEAPKEEKPAAPKEGEASKQKVPKEGAMSAKIEIFEKRIKTGKEKCEFLDIRPPRDLITLERYVKLLKGDTREIIKRGNRIVWDDTEFNAKYWNIQLKDHINTASERLKRLGL